MKEQDELLLREVFALEIWITKPGSSERGEKWQKITEILNTIDSPKFGTNQRSVRERFQWLYDRRKSKNREEERASGISPELTEVDKILDELIDLFENSSLEQKAVTQEKADRVVAQAEEGREGDETDVNGDDG